MLKNINKPVGPELLKILCEMGHGDEIVIADGNFPSANLVKRVIRADGIGGAEILDAVIATGEKQIYANIILKKGVIN